MTTIDSDKSWTRRMDTKQCYPLDNMSTIKEDSDVNSHAEKKPFFATTSPLCEVVLASIIASIGGILFGYDTGIISGAMLLLKKEFSLTSFEQEMLVTAMLIGSFVASFFGGSVVDYFGRKQAIIFSCVLFIAGALLLSFSVNLKMLIVGRFIVGLGISVSVTAECTYISEISPPDRRGMLVSLNEVGITVGFLLAYLLNYAFISSRYGWQYMFGLAVIPAIIQIVGISFMPQSPHHLIVRGRRKEAEALLKRLRRHSRTEEEVRAIETALEEEKSRTYAALLSSENNMRGRMVIGMILVFLQQFSGQTNVLYYAPTVFQYFGYCSNSLATLVSVGLGVVKVLATIFTLLTVDKFGRKVLLLAGCFFMALSVTILGIITMVEIGNVATAYCVSQHDANATSQKPYSSTPAPYSYQSDYNLSSSTPSVRNSSRNGDVYYRNVTAIPSESSSAEISVISKVISVITLMVFVCSYSFSYGPITWLILSEIFPTSLRGRAISVATCVNWGSNIIISLTFLQMLDEMGVGETFIFYGCVSLVAFLFVIFFIPETKNKSLEEISCELSRGIFRPPTCGFFGK